MYWKCFCFDAGFLHNSFDIIKKKKINKNKRKMGGSYSRQDVYLKDFKTVTTDVANDMFKIRVTCNATLVNDEPVIKFKPHLNDGERTSNPFIELKKSLERKNMFACISRIVLVSHHNDLDVPIRIEIHDLFSMGDDSQFKAFPEKEIQNLGGVCDKQDTNDTGILTIEIPGNCNEIFPTAIELYGSPLETEALLGYSGSDNMFEAKNDTVTSINTAEQTSQRREEEKIDDDDNNNNNNIDKKEDTPVVDNEYSGVNFSVFPDDHIFVKALYQYGPSLKITPSDCVQVEDTNLVKVTDLARQRIQNYMNRIFFRNRRYTIFNGTKLVNVLRSNNQKKLTKNIQENLDNGWIPQISFEMWVEYIKVSNKGARTRVTVTKLK